MKSAWILWALIIGAVPGVRAQEGAPLVPIVDGGGMLLGASRGGKWISLEKTFPLLKKAAKYRFYTLKGYDRTDIGSKPEVSQGTGAYYVPFPHSVSKQGVKAIGLGGA